MWAVGCVGKWSAEEMGQRLVPSLRAALSEEELRSARDFLWSPVGIAFSERALYHVPRGSMPEAQISVIREFFETPVAVKLSAPTSIAQFSDALIAASSQAFTDCKDRIEASSKTQTWLEPTAQPSDNQCTLPRLGYPRSAQRQGQVGEATVRLWINEVGLYT